MPRKVPNRAPRSDGLRNRHDGRGSCGKHQLLIPEKEQITCYGGFVDEMMARSLMEHQ